MAKQRVENRVRSEAVGIWWVDTDDNPDITKYMGYPSLKSAITSVMRCSVRKDSTTGTPATAVRS
ncbi:hypothetical protein ACLK15_22295 [Escherichia coli]